MSRNAIYVAITSGVVALFAASSCTTSKAPRSTEAVTAAASVRPEPTTLETASSATAVASTPAASASSAAAQTPCPNDMVHLGKFCIDRYESPNEQGVMPLVMQNAEDGEAWCKAHDKELCDEDQWMRACNGPTGLAYPYGSSYRRGACNDDKRYIVPSWSKLSHWPAQDAVDEVKRLLQAEPSGARESCVSAEGVIDLTGNVGEWVRRTRPNETNHAHVVKGCFWGQCFRVPHEPACDYVNYQHAGGFRSYELGFRCCRKARE
ncbi:MAG: SUMF1/EgtB/PvdO family nonheme iron enzyme [Polyangiaceae bacterium]